MAAAGSAELVTSSTGYITKREKEVQKDQKEATSKGHNDTCLEEQNTASDFSILNLFCKLNY